MGEGELEEGSESKKGKGWRGGGERGAGWRRGDGKGGEGVEQMKRRGYGMRCAGGWGEGKSMEG